MGIIAKAIGTGIGLATEAIAHSKTKKQGVAARSAEDTRRTSSADSDSDTDSDSDSEPDTRPSRPRDIDEDEEAWELDEMTKRLQLPAPEQKAGPPAGSPSADPTPLPEDSTEVKARKEKRMVSELVRIAGPAPFPPRRIADPVIIPQRRPGKKDRGFVHAYAPVLGDCGISQDVFLRFLEDWQTASRASPWIEVVFLTAGIVGFVPEPAAQITSAAVQAAAGITREVQSRQRHNSFLAEANRALFIPRGLFAMVMAFKDEEVMTSGIGRMGGNGRNSGIESLLHAERLNIDTMQQAETIARNATTQLPDGSGLPSPSFKQKLRVASGKTRTELELPEAAELVYPTIDRAAARDLAAMDGSSPSASTGSGAKQKWRSAGVFVADYLDRRAQAEYEHNHQGSSLSVPASARKEFASRYSDPNHPASSGSLVALLTGGTVVPRRFRNETEAVRDDESSYRPGMSDRKMRRMDRRQMKRERKGARRQMRRERKAHKKKRGLKRILKQDVLYLLIINLPTDEEVQTATTNLEQVLVRYNGQGSSGETGGDYGFADAYGGQGQYQQPQYR